MWSHVVVVLCTVELFLSIYGILFDEGDVVGVVNAQLPRETLLQSVNGSLTGRQQLYFFVVDNESKLTGHEPDLHKSNHLVLSSSGVSLLPSPFDLVLPFSSSLPPSLSLIVCREHLVPRPCSEHDNSQSISFSVGT